MHDADLYERLRPQRERVAAASRKLAAIMEANRPTGQVCTKCQRDLEFAAFLPNRKTSTGLSSWCRECHNQANREWRARVRDRKI